MAQTDKEKWLEGAEEYGAPLEDWRKVPVVTEDEIDETMSVPGVKYSTDPSISTRATPQGFVQLHLGSLFSKISGLEGDVEEAISDAETAAGNANTAAARTESAVTAADAAATRANTAATGAEKVDASLVGMTITITDRNGVSVSTNIGFDIYRTYSSVAQMNADAANVPEGKFVMIATTDPTDPENARLYGKNSQGSFTFLSDLDQASSAAWADWLDNMKPQIEADHTRAATDHTTATQDHTTATQDHGVATQDHTRAESDHATATADHTTAGTDHAQASSDHTRAESDHTTASTDHTVATEDHITAGEDSDLAAQDHSTAVGDHAIAASDHTTASTDHTQATEDHTQATTDHTESVTATTNANTQANRAKEWADHPPYIADGTQAHPGDLNYWYIWDDVNDTYVKSPYAKGDDLHWDEMTPEEKQALAQSVLEQLVFATEETCEDIIDELTQ